MEPETYEQLLFWGTAIASLVFGYLIGSAYCHVAYPHSAIRWLLKHHWEKVDAILYREFESHIQPANKADHSNRGARRYGGSKLPGT